MSNSIRLKDNTYLDSSGITHNRTKLNEIIGKVLGTVLYYNSNGTNTTLQLNDSTVNYEYIEIYYGNNQQVRFSQKVYSPHGKTVCLNVHNIFNDANYIDNSRWDIDRDYLYIVGSNTYYIYGGQFAGWGQGNTGVYIYRVVSYK